MAGFLTISSADLTAEISPFGAALARLWVKGHGTSLVLGLERPEDYLDNPDAIGVIVGPIAGRVGNAQVQIGDARWQMEANTPPDCLHSGRAGIQHRRWDILRHQDNEITLKTSLHDGEAGLPGNRDISATYSVNKGALRIAIESQSDADTYLNATSHAYWTLDEGGGLHDHLLRVETNQICETSEALIPTGRILKTTAHDFTSARCPVATPPLDGCFCLSESETDNLREIMTLRSTRSGLGLTVSSNQPGLVLYTGEYLQQRAHPQHCPEIKPFSAIAIEAQGWPDAANHANFPSILREKDRIYRQVTEYLIDLP